MLGLSKKLKKISASPTLAITSLAKSMIRKGEDVVNMGAGEPDFDTPDLIKNAAKTAIDNGRTKYTPASGTIDLKQAVCDKFLRDNGLRYHPRQIVISCGAKHTLYNIFQTICNSSDEVIIISPYWVSYPEMIKLAGAKPKVVKAREKDGFKASIKDIKRAINKKTKAIIINSPSNPAGVLYTKEDLQEIADIVIQKKIYAVSDEIYEKLIYDGNRHISIGSLGKDIFKQCITVNGVSKAYSMTGWRIGYLGASEEIARDVSVIQSHSTSNPTSISQDAALAALRMDEGEIVKMREEFERRRNFITEQLDSVPGVSYIRPQGAFYVFCNIAKLGMKAKVFAKRLLEEKKVAVIPGEAFGSGNHIRMSFASATPKIKEGIDRLRLWVKQ